MRTTGRRFDIGARRLRLLIEARPYHFRLDAGYGAGKSGPNGIISIIEIVVDILSQTGTDDKDDGKLQTIDNVHDSSKTSWTPFMPQCQGENMFPSGALDI